MQVFQFDQLSTLAALIDEGTFEAAAQRLRVTASAVSQRVKAMEQAAGRVLVQRTNPVRTTAAGDLVLRLARQSQLLQHDTRSALAAGGALGADLRDAAAGVGSTDVDDTRPFVSLAVAVNADSLGTWFLDAIAPLGESLHAVFDLYRDDQGHTTDLLRSGTVLAAVTSTREPVQGCTSEPLGVMRYRAVCSPAFEARWRPRGAEAELTWLAGAPMLNFDRKDDLQPGYLRSHVPGTAHVPGAARDPGAALEPGVAHVPGSVRVPGAAREPGVQSAPGRTPRPGTPHVDAARTPPTHYVPTTADFARATVLGLGWSLLPEQQCLAEIAAGTLVELDPDHPVDVSLYWQRWNLDSPTLTALTAAVRLAARAALVE
ncbi:LysR family transcriptional regulator ArgP [Subtercola sp. YIM 133946]|uniref:LysR family transcriptional regulator ArgP n=1 Tax=Subtercola sp. YIM 133946 TaxID=3118909 RepID=UPI002F92D0D6